MPPRRRPGPRPRPAPTGDHPRQPRQYPDVTSFVHGHMIHQPDMIRHQWMSSDVLFAVYKRWLSKMAPTPSITAIANEAKSSGFMRQVLKHAKVRDVWDVKNGKGPFTIYLMSRREIEPWRLSIRLFSQVPRALGEMPIERKDSTIHGSGMFATRMIFPEEIVIEYDGTIMQISPDQLDNLEHQHIVDGNGILELTTGMPSFRGYRANPDRGFTVMNPYLFLGQVRGLAQAPGVWANHAHYSTPTCNATLKTNSRSGQARRLFLIARYAIPAGTEVCWDYGIRDPKLPWSMPPPGRLN